ncbi:MAG TPA: hypothetical protein VFU21_17410 [Kofleriaceae bacterium]|nr:hypothetical protein [Kofleriaceae bacterium]
MSSAPRSLLAFFFALSGATALAGCTGGGSDDPGDSCDGDKCDDLDKPDSEIRDTPCDGVMVDRSGRDNEKVAGRLHDPLNEMVFATGDGCPVTFQDIFEKLAAADTQGCSGEGAGMETRAISETAQVTAQATNYRLVVSRNCNNRPAHGIMFSIFGVSAGDTELPRNVEMISFDETNGIFNYYETDGETLNFFGTSKDFLKGKGSGDDRRCAGCHVGGGLIMKELRAPWIHWEGDTNTPGVPELIAANKKHLGQQGNGIELEGTVDSANSIWNAKRIEAMKEVGDTKEILRPLFCTQEINIGAVNGTPSSVPADFLLDPLINNFPFLQFSSADYASLVSSNGQKVGRTGKTDTFFPMAFPHRSSIDSDYVNQLIQLGILDEELAKDVVLVDFTRPIFSDERCGLLDAVPSIPVAELTAAKLKEGLLANLSSASEGSPEAELKKNLEATGGHDTAVQAFTDACAARPQKDMLTDVLKVMSAARDRARTLQVMEFPETMPDDNQSIAAASRLDPNTCTLASGFVPAGGGS